MTESIYKQQTITAACHRFVATPERNVGLTWTPDVFTLVLSRLALSAVAAALFDGKEI